MARLGGGSGKMKATQPDILRTPPHSVEAEQGVLGSMLWSRDAIAEASDKITHNYFYVPAHGAMFDVLVDLWQKQKPADLITFTQVLRDRNLLESVGGAGFVTSLINFVPTAANIEYYLEIVRDKFILRQLIAAGTKIVRRAYEEQDEVNELLEECQAGVIEIGGLAQGRSRPLAEVLHEAADDILWRFKNRGHCTGISTGFVDLDRMMNGFESGARPYCFAARPAMGKSSLMLAFAKHIAISAVKKKHRVKIFSAEMTAAALAQRLLAAHANLDLTAMRYGTLPHDLENRLTKAVSELMTDFIDIDDDGAITILQLRSRARAAVIHGKCELVMVDYLQRVHGSSKRGKENRQLEIAEVAQGLAEMAKELKVPVVVLAQLNRNPEDRADGKPELGDLRESGAIEQEMGFVGMLWRPSYYANNTSKRNKLKDATKIYDDKDFDGYVECIVAKQNNGPTGAIPLRFVKQFARFEPQDPDRPFLSNRPDLRQYNKEEDAAEMALESVRDVFPNADLSTNGEEHQ
jgi:replicative DNA helicase